MGHRIEVAPSGRASCKTCGNAIAKGELRLGEEYASQFGSDGVAVRWHHLPCAAAKIPAVLGEAMNSFTGEIPDRDALEATMRGEATSPDATSSAAPKKTGAGGLPNADLAPTSRAKCIHCGEAIAKGSVRISVEREVDTGSFTTKSAGYLHPACVETWAAAEWANGLPDLIERVKQNTSLDGLPAPFGEGVAPIAEAGAEPARGAKKGRPPKTTKTVPAQDEVGFGTLTGKQVASIVAKLAKAKDEYRSDDVLEKAGLDWNEYDALRWHVARCGLLPATHPAMLIRLDNSALKASADDLFGAIAHFDKPSKDYSEMLRGWTFCEDRIVLRAFESDPKRLESLVESAVPRVRTGIQFVRGRNGAVLPESDRKQILASLAQVEASDDGLMRSYAPTGAHLDIIVIGPDGFDTTPFVDAIDVARRFGTDEQWYEALERATRAGKFQTLQRVIDGLVRMPLREMVTLLASMYYGSGEAEDRYFATLIARRADAPAALVEAALGIERDAHPGSAVRERLLMHALAEMGKQGLPVPDGLENQLKWDKMTYSMPPWRGSAPERELAAAAIRAFPADRALASVKSMLERGYGDTIALPFLAVHYDDALFRKVIASTYGVADPGLFAPFGARAFDPLREALAPLGESTEDEKRRQSIKECIVAAMAFEAMSNRSVDASLDAYVHCNPSSPSWSEESRKQTVAILNAMPEPRRIATLERLFEDTKQVERPFFCAHTVTDPEYRAKAARRLVQRFASVSDRNTMQLGLREYGPNGLESFRAALLEGVPETKIFTELKYVFGEPVTELMKAGNVVEEKPFARMQRLARERIATGAASTRIYLLERRDLDADTPAPRNGSFSFSRGKGPGIDRDALGVPSEHEHVVTIDIEDVPELASGRPGARAVALYAPYPDHGDGWGDSRLVDVPAGTTAPGDGNALSVVPLDVPREIFDSSRVAEDLVLKELRGLVFNRPGYVLGEPMFIQDDEDDGSGFVMQLASQIGGLNLGDLGSLYVFESGTFMQCY